MKGLRNALGCAVVAMGVVSLGCGSPAPPKNVSPEQKAHPAPSESDVEVDERIEIDDTRALAIMDKMVKQRRDSATQYRDADRPELADVEDAEIAIIQTFLPAQLSAEEIDALIDEALAGIDAEGMAAMGPLMGKLKPQLQGRADMGEVSKRVKAKLGA